MRFSIHHPAGSKDLQFDCDEEGLVLKNFFESEIQQDIPYAAYLLNRLQDTKTHPFELDGNQFEISVSRSRFKIENLFDETESCEGELSFLSGVLEHWLKTMSKNVLNI